VKNRVATIILNRNLPKETDRLYEHLIKYDGYLTDVFVLESGSDHNNLSNYVSWHANWDEAIAKGLRYARGMNYALSNLWKEGKFNNYDSFFLLCNDVELSLSSTISPLIELFNKYPKLGLISPCSSNWGEISLLGKKDTLCFWFIHSNAYFIRREMLKDICNFDDANYMNFLFDGTNFRGYGLEHEIITKGYINNWASAITKKVLMIENESYLLKKADLIKTETYQENQKLYLKEGKEWMFKKFGFKSHWALQTYAKCYYDLFFESNPEYKEMKLY
tara:strand:- start:77 stop:907 length:831 start_codon:yes stop_codon:yes gene_type:complete